MDKRNTRKDGLRWVRVSLPNDIHGRLRGWAGRLGLTLADVSALALVEWMDKQETK